MTVSTLEVVQRFNAAFNAHDVEALMGLMTDDCVFENTYPPPDGARHVGQAAVRAVWQAFFADAPAARFEWEEVVALGERAVVRWTYHWDGGHVRGVDVLTVRAGRVAEKLSYVKG